MASAAAEAGSHRGRCRATRDPRPLALQPTPLSEADSEADHVVFQACCQQGLGQLVCGALIRRHRQQVHIRADIPVAT